MTDQTVTETVADQLRAFAIESRRELETFKHAVQNTLEEWCENANLSKDDFETFNLALESLGLQAVSQVFTVDFTAKFEGSVLIKARGRDEATEAAEDIPWRTLVRYLAEKECPDNVEFDYPVPSSSKESNIDATG